MKVYDELFQQKKMSKDASDAGSSKTRHNDMF